jgi:hypothetical protein
MVKIGRMRSAFQRSLTDHEAFARASRDGGIMYYDIKCGVLKIALLSNSLFGASAAPRKLQAHAGEEVNGMPSMSNRRLLVLVLTLLVGAGGQSLAGTDTQLTLTGVWDSTTRPPSSLRCPTQAPLSSRRSWGVIGGCRLRHIPLSSGLRSSMARQWWITSTGSEK